MFSSVVFLQFHSHFHYHFIFDGIHFEFVELIMFLLITSTKYELSNELLNFSDFITREINLVLYLPWFGFLIGFRSKDKAKVNQIYWKRKIEQLNPKSKRRNGSTFDFGFWMQRLQRVHFVHGLIHHFGFTDFNSLVWNQRFWIKKSQDVYLNVISYGIDFGPSASKV